ncbi:hypothetical protein JQU17_13475 [Ponticoccus sp. SC2-23]|uniref:hypothetical protein n=1 Tax=Alexandriicola marinus TaxID=2081710 RepID=UPI000FD9795F|nr:hypothetical protein [Alexandriicola marinus]MBM1221239.1 hypothetical protein [Ponticoccus sp. SC6-9]MBM1225809.1 hypothetical protein [Ponticoccus sp. SC6-15]MBM1227961.1 hypothetical protein [Ponticoccus sp. SC6-38]MBM1234401.1 hypothetical protein [Ponticoccus sp. SC6-45]MBM1238463.1 hypothetical protein [Ponticoccus sp. SC6-49]MBM1243732.1 hypothetical protein [Ponticoccus sp. SC2-64]MBM1247925.1 hypothetical protein [Ponticoccus sp. SC6-42]MBM1252863.1 hypothetical protein [Pontico
MKRSLIGIVLAITFPTLGSAQSAELVALVREAQAQIGTEIAPGASIAGVSLDGDQFNYLFRFDATRGARIDGGFPAQFAEVLGAGLCQQPPVNAFIRGGGVANVIIEDASGSALHTRTVNRC